MRGILALRHRGGKFYRLRRQSLALARRVWEFRRPGGEVLSQRRIVK